MTRPKFTDTAKRRVMSPVLTEWFCFVFCLLRACDIISSLLLVSFWIGNFYFIQLFSIYLLKYRCYADVR